MTLLKIIKYGSLLTTIFVYNNLSPFVEKYNLCTYAAWCGHLKILIWCRKVGCSWDGRTFAYAADGGHFEILKWCRKNGCPWDDDVCKYVEKNGYLEMLQWCRDLGCLYDEE